MLLSFHYRHAVQLSNLFPNCLSEVHFRDTASLSNKHLDSIVFCQNLCLHYTVSYTVSLGETTSPKLFFNARLQG